uniref:Uncharacterized protein n=1 Tax=Panagrolaimus davidi TaxID=227884 RepID=A0A914QAP1_9BILA
MFGFNFFIDIFLNISFSGWKFVGLSVFGALLVLPNPGLNWYQLITRVRTDRDFQHLLNGTEWEINGKIPSFGALSLIQDGPNEKLPIPSTHMQYFKISYVLISYAMIIFFAISIFLNVRKSEGQLSGGSNKYQRQITIVMTIEAIVPLFSLIVPIMLDLLNIVAGIKISWVGTGAYFVIGFAPVFNPTIKIFVISCYRIWIFERFGLTKFFETSSSSVVVLTTTNPTPSSTPKVT